MRKIAYVFSGLSVGTTFGLILLFFAGVYGYFVNIFELVAMVTSGTCTTEIGLFVLRIVGVFTGIIGAILGWMC